MLWPGYSSENTGKWVRYYRDPILPNVTQAAN